MILNTSAFLHEFTVENLIGGSFIRFFVLGIREGIFYHMVCVPNACSLISD